jgi:phospholipid/cholesterol/gamma-HCH transport system permease protein
LTLRGVLDFVGELMGALGAALRKPRTVNWKDIGRLTERAGADGVPIVFMILFLLGVVTAYQAAVHMHELGADVFVADLVALSLTRELAPLMTAGR